MHFCEHDLIGTTPDSIAGFLDNFDFYGITDAIIVEGEIWPFFLARKSISFVDGNEEIVFRDC